MSKDPRSAEDPLAEARAEADQIRADLGVEALERISNEAQPSWTASLDATWDNAIEACVAIVERDVSNGHIEHHLVETFREQRRRERATQDLERKAFIYGYEAACKAHGASFLPADCEGAYKRVWLRSR